MAAPKIPLNHCGQLRIRFTHKGVRFSIGHLGEFNNSIAYKHAQSICDRINLDILSGNFTANNNGELVLKYHPSAVTKFIPKNLEPIEIAEPIEDFTPKCNKESMIAILEDRLSKKYHSTDKSLLNILKDYKKVLVTSDDAQRLMDFIKRERGVANSTLQRYLNTLRSLDPIFRPLVIRSVSNKQEKPFTKTEVQKIIAWFEKSKVYKFYSGYVKFLFYTGTRTSEAIGLTWGQVDFDENTIYINTVLGRDAGNSSKRVRRPTKGKKPRVFPMSGKLLELMLSLDRGANTDLVFPSPKGKIIDDHNFTNRVWTKCLKEQGIEHRPQYNTRHTFISHFLEKEKDVVKCASLTHGSRSGVSTIYNHYASIINKVDVPELY